ncbi:MAG: hypothetical protein DRQ78_08170 [Epsilonproteobacteria bacterium]|nr:MAG: hypothetical protein DRQ78_08170 [Campylobacterota bacterium]
MSLFSPSLHFRYLAILYIKNVLAILFGLSFAFASIDYFQHIQQLTVSSNHKILYIFYMWQEALGLLYPLAIVFALIMTKLSLVKHNTMGAFHTFGYSKRRLFLPLFFVASLIYVIFLFLHTTEFSYAKDKASALLKNELNNYDVSDIFFKYNDTFVYINTLDPIAQTITDITIFKVAKHQVQYTIHAPSADFDGHKWHAKNAIVKTHHYKNNVLQNYTIAHKKSIETLEGYKPKIIESLYEGKALNILDAYSTWQILKKQNLNSDTIRAVLYDKVIIPLFALALILILFFKLPFHARMINFGVIVALSLGSTFVIWGILFGLAQIGHNAVLIPEFTAILPIGLLWIYALYTYFKEESI